MIRNKYYFYQVPSEKDEYDGYNNFFMKSADFSWISLAFC